MEQTGKVHVLPPADSFRSSAARLSSPQVFRQISVRPFAQRIHDKHTEKAPLANEKGCADFPVLLRAGLIAHRAGSLAGRLAGCLTFAATARVERGLHRRLVDRLDVLHPSYLLNPSFRIYSIASFLIMQVIFTLRPTPHPRAEYLHRVPRASPQDHHTRGRCDGYSRHASHPTRPVPQAPSPHLHADPSHAPVHR